MTLGSALIPIPSEVVMPFAGFLSQQKHLILLLVITVGTFANLFGSLISYYIGLVLGETVLLKLIRNYGKFLLIREKDLLTSKKWFSKYGEITVFVSRFLPLIRAYISLPAGLFQMNIWRFIIYTFLGSLIWSAFLSYIGFYLGSQWKNLGFIFRKFDVLVVIGLVILVFLYLNHKLEIIKFKKT